MATNRISVYKMMEAARCSLLSMLLCCVPMAFAQSVVDKGSPKPAQTEATDFSKEPFVFELIQTRARFEADGKNQRELNIRVRIQSEGAVREFGLLAYSYASSFENLDVVYVRVKKPDGAVVETPAADVQEVDSPVSREAPMYVDQREKHIAVKSLSVGDTLEAGIRWTVHDPLAPGHFWFADSFFHNGICLKETLQLDLPRGVAAKVDFHETQPKIEESAERRIYTFETSNLKKTEEPKIPDWEKNFYGIDPPEVRVSSFTSWAEVGKWFNALQEPKAAVTPDIRAKAEELTKGAKNDEEKIQRLYDFVSLKFRYIGVNLGVSRYTPHAASDVLSNRYGDCKDKHTLLAALLKAEGISAYPALISSQFKMDPGFPSPDLFDHVMTAIPKGDSFTFVDTTPEVAPYGLLVPSLRDRPALVVPTGSAPILVRTPPELPFKAYEAMTIDSSIDADGTLDAKMQMEDRGDEEIALRQAYRNTAQNQWEELTQILVNRMGYGGKVSEVSVGAPEDTTKAFVISFHYHRPEFSDWKNNQMTLPVPPLFLPDLSDEQKTLKKSLPLGAEHEVTYRATVKLPKDYSLVVPDNISRKTEFAEFSAQYTFSKEKILQGTLQFKTLQREVPAGERDKYVELAKSVSEAQSRYIPVTPGRQIPLLVPADLAEMSGTRPEQAIPRLEKLIAEQPGNEAALNMLVGVYTRTGRARDAVPLAEKMVAKYPANPFLMTLLGETYLNVPDVDKAMEQFKKAIDVSPDPMVLNQAAYALGDAKVKLDVAESYSKNAVQQLAEQTTHVHAEDAEKQDFVLMTRLAMNWDTLGWIKFQAGDVENAAKYVRASWDLVQDPLVGEHLVEIYEKQGRRQQAASVCLMASAGFGHELVQKKLSEEMNRLRPYLAAQGPVGSDGAMALSDMRTLHVAFRTKLADKSRWMHVVVAMAPGEKQVEIAYVSGAEELKKANNVLATLKYPQIFPDETPVRVVRKAVFSCSIYAKDCTLVLTPAQDAQAEN